MRQTPESTTSSRRAWGAGSITEESPGVWIVRASAGTGDGRKRAKRRVRGTKSEAGAKWRELVDELEAGVSTTPGTIAELVERYCDDRERLGRSPVTVAEYRRRADRDVVPRIGRRAVSTFTTGDVDAFYAELTREAGFSAVSIKRTHALLHGAFEAAVRWGMAKSNPVTHATIEKPVEPEVDPPTPAELAAILATIERKAPHLAAALGFAARFGLRRGEVTALRWTDLDTKRGELKIERALFSPKGERWVEKSTKGGRARRLPLSEADLAEFAAHRLRCELAAHEAGVKLRRDGFMFPMPTHPSGVEPMRPDYVTNRTRAITKGSLRPHAVRHFFATEIVAAGIDIPTGARLLGHADRGELLLQRYAHVRERQMDAAAGVVGDILRNAAGAA